MKNERSKDAFVEQVREDNETRSAKDKISIDWMTREEAEKMREKVLEKYPEADIKVIDEHFVVTKPNGNRVMIPRKHNIQLSKDGIRPTGGSGVDVFDRIEKAITWMTREEAEKMREKVLEKYPEADIKVTDEYFEVTKPNGKRVMIPRKYKIQQEVSAPEEETGVKVFDINVVDRIEEVITED